MNIHPKVKAASIAATAYTVLVAVLAGVNTLPSSQWTSLAVVAIGALLTVLTAYQKSA